MLKRALLAVLLACVGVGPAHAQAVPVAGSVTITTPPSVQTFTPWKTGSATLGDCTTDNYTSLVAAAAAAIAAGNGVLWTGDSCLAIGTKFVPPAGLVWRADYSDAHPLKWLGSSATDIVEVTGAVDIDGLVIDANRSGAASRTDITVSKIGNPFGVHGTLTTNSKAYLTGVKLGRIKVMHSQARQGMVFANLKDFHADRLEITDSWGGAAMFSGMKDSDVGYLSCIDVGGLQAEGSRYGQCASVFTESDPNKKPANFYTISAQATPNLNIEPTDNFTIRSAYAFKTTDSAIYDHDYDASPNGITSGVTGQGTGVENVTFGAIYCDTIGKDCFKLRHNAGKVYVGSITARRVGAVCASMTLDAYNLHIGHVDCDQLTYDAVGDILGTPAAYDNVDHGNGVGAGQTLSTNAAAVYSTETVSGFQIDSGVVRNIGSDYAGTNGYGCQIYNSTDVKITLTTDTTQGAGCRMSNINRFDLDLTIKDALRRTSDGATGYAVYLLNDGSIGEVQHGRLKLRVYESSGAAVGGYALRVNNAAHDIDIDCTAEYADFLRPAFGSSVAIVGTSTTNIKFRPCARSSGQFTATTDGSGLLAAVNHNLPIAPTFINARIAGANSNGYTVAANATSGTQITFKVRDATGTALATTSVTVIWDAYDQIISNGF